MFSREDWRLIDRATLLDLYRRNSAGQIAELYGVTTGAVQYRLKSFGIKAMETGLKHSPGPKPKFNPDPDEFAALYKRMSMKQVAAHYGVGETVVFHKVKALGLATVSRSERLTGKPKTPEHAENSRKAKVGLFAGPRNPNWKGGVTPENVRARATSAHRVWRETVLKNAGYRCERCKIEQGSRCKCCGHTIHLHVHHKVHFAENKGLRYEVSNGEALCEKCHRSEHY